MPHNSKGLLTMPAPARCTMRREGRTSINAAAKPQAEPQTMRGDSVWVVKSELRSPATGHPLVQPSMLVVDEAYRSKERAVKKMRDVVNSEVAFEIARARSAPRSPAWLNAIPVVDPDATSIQVTRADSMILRYFVEAIPLV